MTDPLCPSCGSCGFPLRQPADYAGGRPGAAFCNSCGDSDGQLRPFDDVLQVNADHFVREQGLDPAAAREMARALLSSMPAWQGRT